MSGEETITKTAARRLRKKAVTMAEEHTRTALDLCEVLYETYFCCVKQGTELVPVWQLWEFESWEDYVEEDLRIHKGRAHTFRRIWSRMMVDLIGHWDENLKLSITHLRILMVHPAVNANTVDEWTRRALTMTCCDLETALGGHVSEMHTFGVYLTGNELKELKTILAMKSANVRGLRKRGESLMAIVREWVHDRHSSKRKRSAA